MMTLLFLSFQAFESVSILFCELVGLVSKTVRETMVVVTTMNNVFSCFDTLVDEFKVYKVRDHFQDVEFEGTKLPVSFQLFPFRVIIYESKT